ncbi:MAG TPA: hypothetical protein PLO68_19150, partial [Sedimentisphaerales bacterium]|nr:hypothetical protein [Sedimentisphaerales bacterium]
SHEAPFVWQWQNAYWLVVDAGQRGIRAYRSQDGLTEWQFNNGLLFEPGKRLKDDAKGGHPGVILLEGRPIVLYHVHYPPDHPLYRTNRTVLQAAELEYHDDKITCNRDKYAKP